MKPNERGAFIAFGMESGFGEDKRMFIDDGYLGPMQMSQDVAVKHGLLVSSEDKGRDDTYDPRIDINTSINIYANETNERIKNVGSWANWDINKRAEDLGISKEQLKYLTWQQGRAGAIDIITTATSGINYPGNSTSGKLGKGMADKLRGNMDFISEFTSKGKEHTELASHYINQFKDMWGKREQESYEKIPPSQEEQVFKKLGLFD